MHSETAQQKTHSRIREQGHCPGWFMVACAPLPAGGEGAGEGRLDRARGSWLGWRGVDPDHRLDSRLSCMGDTE